ncbi:MAG: retropepsin-like aspartic protease family protein [Microcoleaceae cyanobacterium]
MTFLLKPIQLFSPGLWLTSLLLILPIPQAIAQEAEGCFMRTASGKIVNLTSSVCQLNPPEAIAPVGGAKAGTYTIPIKRREANIPVVDVTFNGKETFEMLLDTGASGTVITPEIAKALQVKPTGVVKADTPSQQDVEFTIGKLASIQAGGLVTQNVNVAISPALNIGLLGQDFFGDYDITIKEEVIELKIRNNS